MELTSSGYGYGYGNGSGSGDSYGYGYGYGNGSGSGDSYGSGYGYSYGNGYGSGDSYGYGSGYGYGYGNGSGSGDSYGSGYGSSYSYGDGDGYGGTHERKLYLEQAGPLLNASWVLNLSNAELKREFIEAMGADRFFAQLQGLVVHTDIDGCGNPRSLLRFTVQEAQLGYLQAVRVVCPTTGRIYHLGVPPGVKTCQEAVASTFNMKENEYAPNRET